MFKALARWIHKRVVLKEILDYIKTLPKKIRCPHTYRKISGDRSATCNLCGLHIDWPTCTYF